MRPLPQVLLWLGLMASSHSALEAAEELVDFTRDIRPLLNSKCISCHGGVKKGGGVSFQFENDIRVPGKSGKIPVVAGHPEKSELIDRLLTHDTDERMPKGKTPLTTAQVELFTRWIKQGAPWQKHWAYEIPHASTPPVTQKPTWVQTLVDAFILARLEKENLNPSAPADSATLLRRLSFDLTGLPPTHEEVQAFLADHSPNAYQHQVDRLLSSPRFGERWAALWMDLARYNDSQGYEKDRNRPMWPYRDWLIRSFNQDLPYNQFITKQVAGDLLPQATEDDLVATCFSRLTRTNTEGGTDDEEFRSYAVMDRVTTLSTAFLGTTMGCVQCHGHPYDPFRQTDYYGLFAYFNTSQDADRDDDAPNIDFYSAEQRQRLEVLKQKIAQTGGDKTNKPALPTAKQAKWETLTATAFIANSKNAAKLGKVVQVDGPAPQNDAYTVDFSLANKQPLSALNLQSFVEDKAVGAGKNTDGNFVVSALQAYWVVPATGAVKAQTLRIKLPGAHRLLNLSEVELLDRQGHNLTQAGPQAATAKLSSVYGPGYEADKVINGQHTGKDGDLAHAQDSANPWLEVTLAQEQEIAEVVIWNRTDGGTAERFSGANLTLRNHQGQIVWSTVATGPAQATYHFITNGSEIPLDLAYAQADFSQANFNPVQVLRNENLKTMGWAVSPRQKKAHELVAHLRTPTAPPAGATALRLKLDFEYDVPPYTGYALGSFKLSTSSNPALATGPNFDLQNNSEDPQVAGWKKELAMLKPVRLPVMREQEEGAKRSTNVLVRGAWNVKGDPIKAHTPLEMGAPLQGGSRLDLAKWIASPQNPLTARVYVNHLWKEIFGIGLVATPDDFGTVGEKPSHPELLDTLAVKFSTEWQWSTKRLLREIVLSSAYQQTSQTTPELRSKDPYNRLLAHGPRTRLSAEMIRDQALAVSGLLYKKDAGPSIFPEQPPGIWKQPYSGETWNTTMGPEKYSRTLYIFWKRSSPFPASMVFDAAERDTCVAKRINTNTPLHALVTMNENAFVDASKALGKELASQNTDERQRLESALQRIVVGQPRPHELDTYLNLLHYNLKHYQANPTLAQDAGLSIEAAAWWQVVTVLLNSDRALNKD
jgi:hypothetical protein